MQVSDRHHLHIIPLVALVYVKPPFDLCGINTTLMYHLHVHTLMPGPSSLILLQRHSEHYTASDVLALGKGAFTLVNTFRPASRQQKERERAKMPSLRQNHELPSPNLLLSDLTTCVLGFLNSYLGNKEGAGLKLGDDEGKFVNYTQSSTAKDNAQECGKSRL